MPTRTWALGRAEVLGLLGQNTVWRRGCHFCTGGCLEVGSGGRSSIGGPGRSGDDGGLAMELQMSVASKSGESVVRKQE